jgi:hypothetical protein
MGYLGAGFVLLAVLGGAGGGSGSCQPAPSVKTVAPTASAASSPSASSNPTAAPASLSASPVLTGHPSGSWTTTLYLNTAALCPSEPSFELVTTSPNSAVKGNATFNPALKCGASAPVLTQVQLNFGPCDGLATPPATAAIVVLPTAPEAAPVQFTLAVHRWVSWWDYLWIPLACGFGLSLLFVSTMLFAGLPDPARDQDAAVGGRLVKMRRTKILSRPIYASGAWTFGGSWATNVTAAGAVVAAVLTATGAVTEVLPGVELGRFSLLIAVAGGITVTAPLVFGALNYRFLRVDPTTAGVSVISLPQGPVAVLRGRTRSVLFGWWKRAYKYGGMVVTLPGDARIRTHRKNVPLTDAADLPPGARVTLLETEVTLLDGTPDGMHVPLCKRKALLPDRGRPPSDATITVPAGATITVSGGTTIPVPSAPPVRQAWWGRLCGRIPAVPPPPAPAAGADFTELPARTDATLKSGAVLVVPPGGTITVSPHQVAACLLALPGASNIAIFPDQQVKISPWGTIAAADVTVAPAHADPPAAQPGAPPQMSPEHPGYRLRENFPVRLPGGAQISFLGRANLKLPAGTLVDAPGNQPGAHPRPEAHPRKAVKRSYLKATTVFPIPHTSQVIASQMWSLLIASFLTLLGTGAELGILGVLTFGMAAADVLVRVVCLVLTVSSAVIVFFYSVVSIRALADPTPGDAVSATGSTSFIL